MRLTQKNEIFEYVLPEQNTVGDNQATEISLGETEYTCKKYIIGEAIKKLGELEDVLEKYDIETTEELDGVLKPLIDNGELENWKSAIFWKMQTERLNKELDDLFNTLKTIQEKQDQDKISFAIEQLEKVKGLIANHTQELWTCEDDDIDVVLYEEIDNQIKELKGGK